MDSFGIGASYDADKYGDLNSNTLGHIADYCVSNRNTPLTLPNLSRLGLNMAAKASTGQAVPGLESDIKIESLVGYAVEQSLGKDTPSGHWEIAGVPVNFEWGYFPPEYPSFPDKLINAFVK